MRLTHFSCTVEAGNSRTIECDFKDINLIVGKNASGKSFIVEQINILAGLLCGVFNISHLNSRATGWRQEISFIGENVEYKYIIEYRIDPTPRWVTEELTRTPINKPTQFLIRRQEHEKSSIWAEKLNTEMEIGTPENLLIAFSKRDSVQHPYLEDLYQWAQDLRYYQFGSDFGKSGIFMIPRGKDIKLKEPDNVPLFLKDGQLKYAEKFKQSIIEDITFVGYRVVDVFPVEMSGADNRYSSLGLFLQEEGLDSPVNQYNISQGMYRVLALIIHLNYYVFSQKSGCLLIDDVGEGIDYSRARRLTELIVEKAKQSNLQVIMTSNDERTINAVPFEYLMILHRDGPDVKVYNYENAKAAFDDFAITGLSPFDFFTSQYYLEDVK